MSTEVLIVGAGPTGLVLALWLARRGIRLRIIDKADKPGTTSRAIAVQSRTLEFYRQLGIANDVVKAGLPLTAVNLWARGRKAAHLDLERLGADRSPFPGIGDAINLAWKLAAALGDRAPERILDTYSGPRPCGAARDLGPVPARGDAALPVPDRVADGDRISGQRLERGTRGTRPRGRSPAVGSKRAGQLRAVGVA